MHFWVWVWVRDVPVISFPAVAAVDGFDSAPVAVDLNVQLLHLGKHKISRGVERIVI